MQLSGNLRTLEMLTRLIGRGAYDADDLVDIEYFARKTARAVMTREQRRAYVMRTHRYQKLQVRFHVGVPDVTLHLVPIERHTATVTPVSPA